jgi:hypothetical protein
MRDSYLLCCVHWKELTSITGQTISYSNSHRSTWHQTESKWGNKKTCNKKLWWNMHRVLHTLPYSGEASDGQSFLSLFLDFTPQNGQSPETQWYFMRCVCVCVCVCACARAHWQGALIHNWAFWTLIACKMYKYKAHWFTQYNSLQLRLTKHILLIH